LLATWIALCRVFPDVLACFTHRLSLEAIRKAAIPFVSLCSMKIVSKETPNEAPSCLNVIYNVTPSMSLLCSSFPTVPDPTDGSRAARQHA